jgi:hypothetical protein
MAAVHIDGIQSIEIKGGVVCVSAVSDGETIKWKMPLAEYRRALMVANAVLAEHDHPGRIVPIKRIKLDG